MVWTWPMRGSWNLLDEVNRLQSEMNRLFDPVTRTGRRSLTDFPAVNIWTGPEEVLLTAETPGVDPDQVDVSVKDAVVTIRGHREPEQLEEGQSFIRQERGAGTFVRSFTLPYRVEVDNVEARYEKGVLLLRLPRAKADMPRKITVNAG